MAESRRRAGLLEKTKARGPVLLDVCRECLDRHRSAQLGVDRLEHFSHPALADLLDNRVMEKGLT